MPESKNLNLIVSQVRCRAGLTNMSDPKHLDFTASEAWENVCLTNIPDLKILGLTVN
jgi:hypothetical protein